MDSWGGKACSGFGVEKRNGGVTGGGPLDTGCTQGSQFGDGRRGLQVDASITSGQSRGLVFSG